MPSVQVVESACLGLGECAIQSVKVESCDHCTGTYLDPSRCSEFVCKYFGRFIGASAEPIISIRFHAEWERNAIFFVDKKSAQIANGDVASEIEDQSHISINATDLYHCVLLKTERDSDRSSRDTRSIAVGEKFPRPNAPGFLRSNTTAERQRDSRTQNQYSHIHPFDIHCPFNFSPQELQLWRRVELLLGSASARPMSIARIWRFPHKL